MTFLLDTNICISIIRQKSSHLLARLVQQPLGDVVLSSITVAELAYGVAKSAQPERNRNALEQFLLPFSILDFDYRAAENYGIIRADLECRGLPIGGMDLLIAAHALAINATLVTNNTREFTRIPNLIVEDWLDS